MGVLYLAEDINIKRNVVLKFLPEVMASNPELNLRFKREAQAAGALSHPNIIIIYDVGDYEGKTFIAMEYIEGKTLRDIINEEELSIEQIYSIAIQVCEGLSEAHNNGIIHRDIKPENLLIDSKGRVRILDFGLAKINDQIADLTRQGSIVGTLKYMSPEQLRNEKVDGRSDIWSFGVILYEMITGKYPFRGDHNASIFYSITSQQPEPISSYKADLSPGLQLIIDKTLMKEPDARYLHTETLLIDLMNESRSEQGSVHTADQIPLFRKKYIKAGAILLLSAIILFITTYYLKHPAIVKPARYTKLTFVGNVYTDGGSLGFERSQISPDGQMLAYIVDAGDEKILYVQEIATRNSIEIFRGPIRYIRCLRWSPSSREILFSVDYNDGSNIGGIIPRLGGRIKPLRYIQFGSWSPDESLIAGIDSGKIIILNKSTNEVIKRIKVHTDSTGLLVETDWSPEGNHILFITFSRSSSGTSIISSVKSDGTGMRKLYENNEDLFSPRWSYNGRCVYFMRSNEYAGYQNRDLMKLEVTSSSPGKPEIVMRNLNSVGFSLTRDNKKLCYTKNIYKDNLWCFKYENVKRKYIWHRLNEGISSVKPDLSPDGKEIVYVQGVPKAVIYKTTVAGDSIQQLTFSSIGCYNPVWSPNGKKIAFSSQGLFFMSSSGGAPILIRNTEIDLTSVQTWLTDSLICYNRAKNNNLYVVNTYSYDHKPIWHSDRTSRIYNPRLSPDKYHLAVYCIDDTNRALRIINMKDLSEKIIREGKIYPLVWSPDGKFLYAYIKKAYYEIVRINIDTHKTESLFSLPFTNCTGIDITSDGKVIAASFAEENADVWTIENFDPGVN